MNEDNLFPNHWGLQDVDSETLGMDFPKAPDFPDPMAEEGKLVNYLSPFVREYEFTSIDAKEIVANYFYNLPVHTKGKKLSWIKEPECKLEIVPHKIFVFRDQDGKEGYHANEDELLYTIYVYISSSNSKLKKIYEFSENRIGDDEILLFVEDNIGDWSDQIMYARFGKKVNKELLLSMSSESMELIYDKMPDFDDSKLRELISNGVVKAKTSLLGGLVSWVIGANIAIGATGKALGWVSSMIGEGIEQLMIPESIWDSKGEDYFLDKENIIESYRIDTSVFGSWQQKIIEEPQWKAVSVLLPSLTWSSSILLLLKEMVESYNMAVETIIDLIYSRYEESVVEADAVFYLSEQTAFLCGLWNGLIDFVAGIFKFTGDLLSFQFDIARNYKEILEAIDDFREAWSAFSLIEFFETAWKLQLDFYIEIIKFLVSPDPREAYNFDRFAYFAGFGTAFIGSLFIPLANISRVSSITKYSKFIPEDFVSSLNIAKIKELKGSKALVNWLEEIATLLGKKGDALYQELKKLVDKVVEWLKKNSKKFEKLDTIADEAVLLKFMRRNHIRGDIDLSYVLRICNNRKDLAESLLLSLKEVKEGKTVIQLIRFFKITDPPVLASLSNYQTRIWYSWKKMQIEGLIKNIKSLEDKAKKAFELRNEYRSAARQYMKDRNWADYLEEVEKNMTWEEIIKKALKSENINTIDDAYNKIIFDSQKGRDSVDKMFKLK